MPQRSRSTSTEEFKPFNWIFPAIWGNLRRLIPVKSQRSEDDSKSGEEAISITFRNANRKAGYGYRLGLMYKIILLTADIDSINLIFPIGWLAVRVSFL